MKTELKNDLLQLLCPPGNGVYTVHTGGEKRSQLHQILFGKTNQEEVNQAWKKQVEKLFRSPKHVLLGVTSDAGGGILRGANWGPLYLREELYKNEQLPLVDVGDVRTIPHLLDDKYLNSETIRLCQEALYGKANHLPVSPLSITEHFCKNFYLQFPKNKILGLGGDHSVSYPLCNEWLLHKKNQKKKVAVIHFDAHTDLLNTRLGIERCFGTWAYQILGQLAAPDHLIQIGIRSSGRDKAHWENTLGIKQFWANEIKTLGVNNILEQIIIHLKAKKVTELYISFDIDAIDSDYVSATGTPEAQGMLPHEAVVIIKTLAEHFTIGSTDLVEVAPHVRTNNNPLAPEPLSTLMVATQIIKILSEVMHGDH
ncbi:MAG: arginase family protein [Bacteriovoracaceae bacterium]|nr:arginase family protein [Bacteriovoracaceae bacterium]